LLCALLFCAWPRLVVAQAAGAELSQLQVERAGDAVLLSATTRFDLPTTVEEALLKGIPIIFVVEAELVRERWYWTNKKVASAERHMRLAFQPLTRRWRLNIASGPIAMIGIGMALTQNFDTLADALSSVQRISRWKIADAAELDLSQRHLLQFRFRLDVTQLPRPLQIGTLGDTDWDLAVSTTRTFLLEPGR
jgi:hypothetical protein